MTTLAIYRESGELLEETRDFETIANKLHGVGVLLCTHLLDDVDRLCRRIGIIAGGRTVVQGELAELLRQGERLDRYRNAIITRDN